LRVALVGPSFPPQLGGVEVHLARLADGLTALGCDVDVLVQRHHADPPVPKLQALSSGVRVRWFPSRTRSRRFPVAPSLVTYLRSNLDRFDVIHGHSFHAVPGVLAIIFARGPAVFTAHYHGGGHTPAARALHHVYRPIGARATRGAHALIANSQYEADLLSANFCLPKEDITVLYPGIDVEDILAAVPYPTGSPVILTGGRLEDYKQVDLAIAALRLLPPATRLTVMGDGPSLPRLQRTATTLGVADRVTFLGRLDTQSVRRWQRTASVYVSLSRHEAFGLTLLESLAAGARVVATDIPASREISNLVPARTHFLPVTPSPAQVADAIQSQLAAPRTTPRLEGLPTWPKLSENCLAIYRDVVGPSAAPLLRAR
jgi:glycosyltransferase involved in cell wall biosynthesis